VRRIAALVPLPEAAWTLVWDELRQHGYLEGAAFSVDRRGFEARYEQFPRIVADLIQGNPDVIICGGDAAIRAAQTATSSIPIVAITDDMVGAGLVRSLARPGGNTTGISILAAELDSKRQEVLLDYLPATRHMAALSDGQNNTSAQIERLLEAARLRGIVLSVQRVQRTEDILPALDAAEASGATALNVLASPLLHANRLRIIGRTTELRLPAIYQWPDTAKEGGLLGYGPRFGETLRLLARQVVRVLRGAAPASLPVEQPTKFELAVNEVTAKAIGVEFSPTLLARADEVIE
jgi:putative ABC transport system substrate-binding protein